MQFHSTATDPTATARLACRNARWNLLVLLAVFWVIPFIWWYLSAPTWVLVITGAIPLLITLPIYGVWKKRGRRDNWVLAIADDGLWLNLRDCEYHEAPPALTVLFVSYPEITAARRVLHRYTTPSGNGNTTHYRNTYLELCLAEPDNGELKNAINQERHRELPERKYLGGYLSARTNRTQSPIEMESDDAVRIKFSASNYVLRPTLKKVMVELSKYVEVQEDLDQTTSNWKSLDEPELNEEVNRLAAGGQKLDAIRLLQNRRGMSLTEAKLTVEAMRAQH
jgi:hypothetical protein